MGIDKTNTVLMMGVMHMYQFEHVLLFGAFMMAIGYFLGRRR